MLLGRVAAQHATDQAAVDRHVLHDLLVPCALGGVGGSKVDPNLAVPAFESDHRRADLQ